jgi:glucose/arabinose dehydrogenase
VSRRPARPLATAPLRPCPRPAARRRLAACLAALSLPALVTAQAPPPAADDLPLPTIHPASVAVRLEVLHDDLTLPVSLVPLEAGRGALLLTQLDGLVRVLESGRLSSEPFLSLRHRVTALEGEQGLYGVALEPEARARARGRERMLVAAFTEIGSGDLIVAGYPVDAELRAADPAGELELLRVAMPEPFHHGGQVRFGPDDMLWVSIGDGEASTGFLHQVPPTSQSLADLRGSLLRIDAFPAARPGEGEPPPYRVPDDNPFVGVAEGAFGEPVRPEIWAHGFRNPWKFTFDERSGALFLADVGADRWEEINLVTRGGNYGWPSREGPECQWLPDGPGMVDPACPERTFEEPLVAYAHLALDPNGGQAVVGGVVVRDPELPSLSGRYLFGDFVTGRLWSLDLERDRIELLIDTDLALTAIAQGPRDEVFLLGVQGVMARLVLAP